MLDTLNKLIRRITRPVQMLFLLALLPLAANSATLQCSPQKGDATINEVFAQSQNDNFIEIKIFDPAYTSYSGWKILYCDDGDLIGNCTTSVADVSTMTQENIYWFTQQNVSGLKNFNSNNDFTLLLVDNNNDLIDMLSVENGTLGDTVNCAFYYDTTANTNSAPKAIRRNPDGTGAWEDSPGTGATTETTSGESNDGIPSAQIMADYRMDECSWDGTSEEVLDGTVPAYNGTSKLSATTSVNMGGGICNNGVFLNNYVELSTFPHINASRTVTAWFNTANIAEAGQRIFADDESNNNGSYSLSVGDPGQGRVRFYIRGLSPISLDSNAVLQNNTWYFTAVTFNSVTMLKTLYIYDASGSLLDEVSQTVSGTVGTPSGNASLGGETVVGETTNRFNGFLDEVKIFDGVLYRTEIETMLNNERNGQNYDGSTRTCTNCNPCGTYSGSLDNIQFVGDQITLLDTYSVPQMTHVTYKNNYVFSENPVIFILPNTNGGNPANMRVRNVDSRGFDVAMVEPQGEDGAHIAMKVDYFAINAGDISANSGSQVYELGNQLIEVGYIKTTKQQKGYDLGTNEWETITPKGNFCNPVVVTQIQGMVNEPSYDPTKPSSPYLTTATEINGQDITLALERSETNTGTVSQPEMIAYMISEANVQDSFIDDTGRVINFETIQTGKIFYGWTDTAVSTTFGNTYPGVPLVAASLNSRDSLDGGWFRWKTHTTTNISLVIDEDRKTSRSSATSVQDSERSKRANVADGNPTTPESAGIFVFDGTFIKTGSVKLGSINAVNVAEKDIFDGNISTQIAGTLLDLALVAREDDNVTKRDANISKVEIVNCADDLCLDCLITADAVTVYDNPAAPIEILATSGYKLLSDAGVSYTLSTARKIQKIRLTEAGEAPSCSFDTFATRPDKYSISTSSPVYAGENFTLNFRAPDINGVNTVNYNESDSDSSFVIDYRETRPECNFGEVLSLDTVAFSDGSTPNIDANFTGIALYLNIGISENNGSEFARIDNDDTPDITRLISPYDVNISVLPYELNVTMTQIQVSTSQNWLYMASVDDMNLSSAVTIQANNKNHNVLKDFNASCYAQDVDFSFDMTVFDGDNSLDMNYTASKGVLLPSGTTLADIDQSMRIPASDFTDGVGSAALALNVDRSYNSPVSPFKIMGLGASISSAGVAKVVNDDTDLSEGNFTFYYGRLRPSDLITTLLPSKASIFYEVHDNAGSVYTQGMKQTSLSWYVNDLHNNNNEGNVTEAIASSDTLINNALGGFNFSYEIVSLGQENLSIDTASTSKSTIHLRTQEWLWYVPSGFGLAYDDNAGSDCRSHPCLKFSLLPVNSALKIESGDFNGTTVPDVIRKDYSKKGVKLFR